MLPKQVLSEPCWDQGHLGTGVPFWSCAERTTRTPLISQMRSFRLVAAGAQVRLLPVVGGVDVHTEYAGQEGRAGQVDGLGARVHGRGEGDEAARAGLRLCRRSAPGRG